MAGVGDARLPGEAAVVGGRRLLRSEGEAEVGEELGHGEVEGAGGLRRLLRLLAVGKGEDERRLHRQAEGVGDGRPRLLEGERAVVVGTRRRRGGEAEVEGGSGDHGRRGSLPLSERVLDDGPRRCKDVEPTYLGDRTSRGGVSVQRRKEKGQHGGELHVGSGVWVSGAGRQGKKTESRTRCLWTKGGGVKNRNGWVKDGGLASEGKEAIEDCECHQLYTGEHGTRS